MNCYVVMGRDDSYTLANHLSLHNLDKVSVQHWQRQGFNLAVPRVTRNYYEAQLENDAVVKEVIYYNGLPVPHTPQMMRGYSAVQLRTMGFRTWSMGRGDWRYDDNLVQIEKAIRRAAPQSIGDLRAHIPAHIYQHLADILWTTHLQQTGESSYQVEKASIDVIAALFADDYQAASV